MFDLFWCWFVFFVCVVCCGQPGTTVKNASFSQFAKLSTFDYSAQWFRNKTQIMGYTVRVPDWRYTYVNPTIDSLWKFLFVF